MCGIVVCCMALLSLSSAAPADYDPDQCCLTNGQVTKILQEKTCITTEHVPHCLMASAAARVGTSSRFILQDTVSVTPQGKLFEVCLEWAAIGKVVDQIQLVYDGKVFEDLKAFRKQIKEGDILILLMKYTKPKKQCELIGIRAISLKSLDLSSLKKQGP